MAIGFSVGNLWYPVGTGSFLTSFFSTIYVKLENSIWGSKYPITMNKLYQGTLPVEDIDQAEGELNDIVKKLETLSPANIVWNHEDLKAQPPWGNNISSDITNMSNYFVTSSGDDFIEILRNAYKKAKEDNVPIEIQSL